MTIWAFASHWLAVGFGVMLGFIAVEARAARLYRTRYSYAEVLQTIGGMVLVVLIWPWGAYWLYKNG